jgi:hypothetical protein
MYVNMAIADTTEPVEPYSDTPKPRRFGTVSPLDPQMFSTVEELVADVLANRVDGRYHPVEVARWLDDLADEAEDSLRAAKAKTDGRASFRRLELDVSVTIELGRFFADKFRAATWYALHQSSGDAAALAVGVREYQQARAHWQRAVEITLPAYVADVSYGEGWFQRGHWSDRLAAIDRDLAAMSAAATQPVVAGQSEAGRQLGKWADGSIRRPDVPMTHVAPRGYPIGRPVEIVLPGAPGVAEATLYFRRMTQAERWRSVAMEPASGGFRGEIPADAADGSFPLQYYFEVRVADGRAMIVPGLAALLANQPYCLLRPLPPPPT